MQIIKDLQILEPGSMSTADLVLIQKYIKRVLNTPQLAADITISHLNLLQDRKILVDQELARRRVRRPHRRGKVTYFERPPDDDHGLTTFTPPSHLNFNKN